MDKLYTINEVATKLNLSDKTLRRWEEAGRFSPSRTLGNQRRYSLEDLQILDALKHNIIREQKDLLSISQAAELCGVSPSTIDRWENEGKIHPFITSGNTYYPKTRLLEKLDELKKSYLEPTSSPQEPEPTLDPVTTLLSPLTPLPQSSLNKVLPSLSTNKFSLNKLSNSGISPYLINLFLTLILLLSYHFIFYSSPQLVSPQVQGVATSILDPRVDDLLAKFESHLGSEMLKDAQVKPVSTLKLDNASLISGSATLSKGQNQISVSHPTITPTTLITASFTTDYTPAKKYWISPTQGSFTLYTDFPVAQNSTFNYLILESTPSATLAL
ncbi:MAG: Resolvase domain-containing protein [Microgenomates group bacterium GW2011_GWA2_46_7]|nr:MAG: Resolvase domain-containing protein [Microgenomates group bacterium GW2011_GWA2_46_7]